MVKAIDLKSISLWERRFEPYHLRNLFLPFPISHRFCGTGTAQEIRPVPGNRTRPKYPGVSSSRFGLGIRDCAPSSGPENGFLDRRYKSKYRNGKPSDSVKSLMDQQFLLLQTTIRQTISTKLNRMPEYFPSSTRPSNQIQYLGCRAPLYPVGLTVTAEDDEQVEMVSSMSSIYVWKRAKRLGCYMIPSFNNFWHLNNLAHK